MGLLNQTNEKDSRGLPHRLYRPSSLPEVTPRKLVVAPSNQHARAHARTLAGSFSTVSRMLHPGVAKVVGEETDLIVYLETK